MHKILSGIGYYLYCNIKFVFMQWDATSITKFVLIDKERSTNSTIVFMMDFKFSTAIK